MPANQRNNRPSPPRITINPSSPHRSGLFSATPSSSSIDSTSTPLSAVPTLLSPGASQCRSPRHHHHRHQGPLNTPAPSSLYQTLSHLRTPLHPLVSSVTGTQHPDFPRNLLAFHLLTNSQLDELARHYHQVWPPVQETFWYPIWVKGWVSSSPSVLQAEMREDASLVDLATKRRRFGRFIGLRGCESPVQDHREDANTNGVVENSSEMLARMEREWQEALARAANEDLGAWREKGW